MNFRLKDTAQRNSLLDNQPTGLELDTPYFRRSMAVKNNPGLDLVELRITQFLEEKGVAYIKLEEEFDDAPINKNLNFVSAISNNKETNSSDRLDSRSSSLSSFNLDSNSLFLRRKASVVQPPLSGLRES